MAWEVRPNTATLFNNDRKSNPKAPDMKSPQKDGGLLELPDGSMVPIEVAGWWREGKRGRFLSLTVKIVDQEPSY